MEEIQSGGSSAASALGNCSAETASGRVAECGSLSILSGGMAMRRREFISAARRRGRWWRVRSSQRRGAFGKSGRLTLSIIK